MWQGSSAYPPFFVHCASLPPNLLWTITTHFLLETQTKWNVFCNRQQERLLHIHLWSNLLGILSRKFNSSLNRGCLCHFPRTSIRAVLAQIRSLVAPFVLHTGLKLGKAGNSQKPETTRLGDKSLSLTQQILIAERMCKSFHFHQCIKLVLSIF